MGRTIDDERLRADVLREFDPDTWPVYAPVRQLVLNLIDRQPTVPAIVPAIVWHPYTNPEIEGDYLVTMWSAEDPDDSYISVEYYSLDFDWQFVFTGYEVIAWAEIPDFIQPYGGNK